MPISPFCAVSERDLYSTKELGDLSMPLEMTASEDSHLRCTGRTARLYQECIIGGMENDLSQETTHEKRILIWDTINIY